MLVYGRNVALEVLKRNIIINRVYMQENFDFEYKNEFMKYNVKVLKKHEMDRKFSGLHQGIAIDIEDYKYVDINNFKFDNSLVVMLDHIEDPHNFGAIIRTCEAAGIGAIIIPKDRQVPINATVMKTSVGTLDAIKIISVSNIAQSIEKLKEAGFWIVGTSLEDSMDYRSVDYSGKIALVIGNEGEGISSLVAKKCDFLVKIPMYGTTNSLNASVAAGIMIYEMIRNRK